MRTWMLPQLRPLALFSAPQLALMTLAFLLFGLRLSIWVFSHCGRQAQFFLPLGSRAHGWVGIFLSLGLPLTRVYRQVNPKP